MKILNCFLLASLLVCITNVRAQQISKTARSSKEARIVDKIELKEDEVELFKEQTKQKVEEFQQHIIILGDKEQPQDKRNMAEHQALKLFYKGAVMEVSHIDNKEKTIIKTRSMEDYLYRLKTLPYTRVVIDYYDIAYITDFVKGPDNKYYAVATIFQEFTGFVGDNIKYADITQKEIEIIVEPTEDKFYNEKRWKIFLGNIKATETKTST